MPTIPIIGVSVWAVAKIAILIFLSLYIFFAVVVVRQAQLMTETLEVGFETPIKLLAASHLVLAIVVFLFALISL